MKKIKIGIITSIIIAFAASLDIYDYWGGDKSSLEKDSEIMNYIEDFLENNQPRSSGFTEVVRDTITVYNEKVIVINSHELDSLDFDRMLKFNSINSIRVGMTSFEFKKLLNRTVSFPYRDSLSKDEMIIVDHPEGKVICYSKDRYESIHMITTTSPNYETQGGVHVGMTVEDYLSIYPSTERMYISNIDETLYFLPRDLNMKSNMEGVKFMVEIQLENLDETVKREILDKDEKGGFYDIRNVKYLNGIVSQISVYTPGEYGVPIFGYHYTEFN